ncbi:hypothetical protein V5098_19055 [Vibrio coralliirubri]|uniref:hypothetical protein n=1 Tax=Vibrio coralliirubri TaxID=1516159 RepID=UPI002FCE6A55
MQLTTKISVDSTEETTIVLDKFFQFIVLNKQNDNRCEVTIYNAIAFHNEVEDSKLIVEFLDEKGQSVPMMEHDDKVAFYKNSDVLSQFWGSESRYDANISNVVKEFTSTSCTGALSSYLKELDIGGVFGVKENKPGIDNIIIVPLNIKNETNQVVLKQKPSPENSELNKFISYGYWFKSVFNIDLNIGQNGFSFTSNIDFPTNMTVKSPDFKTYIQTSKKYDVCRSKVEVKDRNDSKVGEIIKVFSQSKIKYFDEWADLGIYTSSLFKVNYGTAGDKLISEGGVCSISVKADMEDLEKPRRREINLLIFSIVFSLFTSFGFDRTRQTELNGFSTIFPDWQYFSIDALWLFVCLGILIKFRFIKQVNIRGGAKLFLSMPIGVWFMCYILVHQSPWLESYLEGGNRALLEKIYHILYYCNIAVIVYMTISIVLVTRLRPRRALGGKKNQSSILKFFGV